MAQQPHSGQAQFTDGKATLDFFVQPGQSDRVVLETKLADGFWRASDASNWSFADNLRIDKLKAPATTGKTRSPVLPDVPTVAEQGYAGFEAVAWIGLLAPAKTPPEIVAKLNADVKKIIETPEFKARLSVHGFNAEWQKPETFAGHMKNEVQKWGTIVKSANVKVG